jgi:A/G-specific adenine glycosylase
VQAAAKTTLRGFVHTFSHYHLQITPLLVQGTPAPDRVGDDPDRRWYSHEELAALGLPAPVRKLLQTLHEESR